MDSKTKLLSVIAVVAVLIVIYYFAVPFYSSFEFKGNLKSLDEDTLIVSGRSASQTELDPFDAKVVIDEDTVIHRIGLKIPAGSASFNADSLPREESEVDLATLKADARTAVLGMEISMKRVLYKPGYFIARSITYRVPIFEVPRQ